MTQVSKVSDLHKRWSKEAAYQAAYDELGSEFELAGAMIEAGSGGCPTRAQPGDRTEADSNMPALVEKCSSTGPA